MALLAADPVVPTPPPGELTAPEELAATPASLALPPIPAVYSEMSPSDYKALESFDKVAEHNPWLPNTSI